MTNSVETSVANQLRFVFNQGIQPPVQSSPMQAVPSQPVQNDSFVNSASAQNGGGKFDYSLDDGKISAKDKAKNFVKGVVSPLKALFSSPKNFLVGAAAIAAGAALIVATGGAAAPVMVALGVAGGGIQLAKSVYKAATAKTDEEAKKAWQGLGLGTTTVAGSIFGSKAALKGAGVGTEGMGYLKATVECFKQTPACIGKSIHAFTSGEALLNLKNALHIKDKKAPEQKEEPKAIDDGKGSEPAQTEPKTEPKAEPKAEQKPAEPKPEEPKRLEAKNPEPKTEQPVETKPQTEPKAEKPAEVKPQTETKTEPAKPTPSVETAAANIGQFRENIIGEFNKVVLENKTNPELIKECPKPLLKNITETMLSQIDDGITEAGTVSEITQETAGVIEQFENIVAQAQAGEQNALAGYVENIINALEKTLSEKLGVTVLKNNVGAPFDPATMEEASVILTQDISLNDTIARVVSHGFTEPGGFIKPERVITYSFKA